MQCFDIRDLKTLCADLGIDYDNLQGEDKQTKVVDLVQYMRNRGEIGKLSQYCISERPHFQWFTLGESRPITDNEPKSQTVILFLASDPTDQARLRIGQEFREIKEKLQISQGRDKFKLALPELSVRAEDISQALLDITAEIVHFSGHGASVGLVFENRIGQTQLIDPEALAALFEQFAKQLKCVILNACYSETQAKAIARHINFVIGMNQEIGDQAAIAFSVGFYQALGAGRTVEEAYKMGCVQIRLSGISEHLTPILIKKGDK